MSDNKMASLVFYVIFMVLVFIGFITVFDKPNPEIVKAVAENCAKLNKPVIVNGSLARCQ